MRAISCVAVVVLSFSARGQADAAEYGVAAPRWVSYASSAAGGVASPGSGIGPARKRSWMFGGGGALVSSIRSVDDFGLSKVTLVANPSARGYAFEPTRTGALARYGSVSAGIAIDLVLRRLLIDAVSRLGNSALIQVVLSAAAFGLEHSAWVLTGGQLSSLLPVALSPTLLGAGFALVYLLSEPRGG